VLAKDIQSPVDVHPMLTHVTNLYDFIGIFSTMSLLLFVHAARDVFGGEQYCDWPQLRNFQLKEMKMLLSFIKQRREW